MNLVFLKFTLFLLFSQVKTLISLSQQKNSFIYVYGTISWLSTYEILEYPKMTQLNVHIFFSCLHRALPTAVYLKMTQPNVHIFFSCLQGALLTTVPAAEPSRARKLSLGITINSLLCCLHYTHVYSISTAYYIFILHTRVEWYRTGDQVYINESNSKKSAKFGRAAQAQQSFTFNNSQGS